MENKTINILGTDYKIIYKNYDDDIFFEEDGASGYCRNSTKEIIMCDIRTYKGWSKEPEYVIQWQMKETLRHEILHAFFNESGLASNTNTHHEWARDEEMIDWFALQGPKIYKAWQEADAL